MNAAQKRHQPPATLNALVGVVEDPVTITPHTLLQRALQSGADMVVLERLMDLQDRYDAKQARNAYNQAVAAFKANVPTVVKDKKNLQYGGAAYVSVAAMVNGVNPALAAQGLTARWDIAQTDKITVTCILSHSEGHSESVSMTGAPDKSGSKNPLQEIKSTITYLKLATYEAVTGTASVEGNTDDDGNGAGKRLTITEGQELKIRELAESVNADIPAFLHHLGVDKISDLLCKDFQKAWAALKDKERINAKKAASHE